MSKTVKTVLVAVIAAALFFLPVAFAHDPVTLSLKNADSTAAQNLTVGDDVVITAEFTPATTDNAAADKTADDTESADKTADTTASTDKTADNTESADKAADTTASTDKTADNTESADKAADTTASTDKTADNTESADKAADTTASTDKTADNTESADKAADTTASTDENADTTTSTDKTTDAVTVTFTAVDSSVSFKDADGKAIDSITVDATGYSDGSYTASADLSILVESGSVKAVTSDGQEGEVKFTASPKDTAAEETTKPVLTIYKGDPSTGMVKNTNKGFSAILTQTDKDGKDTQLDTANATWTWGATLDGTKIDVNETEDHAITVKPASAGKLVVSCSIELDGKTYEADPVTVLVADEETPLQSVKISSDKTEGIAVGDTVTVKSAMAPADCTNLDGAAVAWTAEQNGTKIAESDSLSDFTFTPDAYGDITVNLSVTPKDKDAVKSNTLTLTMAEPTVTAVITPVTDIDNGVDAGTTVTFKAGLKPEGSDQIEGLTYNWKATDSKGNTILTSDQAEFTFSPAVAGTVLVSLEVQVPKAAAETVLGTDTATTESDTATVLTAASTDTAVTAASTDTSSDSTTDQSADSAASTTDETNTDAAPEFETVKADTISFNVLSLKASASGSTSSDNSTGTTGSTGSTTAAGSTSDGSVNPDSSSNTTTAADTTVTKDNTDTTTKTDGTTTPTAAASDKTTAAASDKTGNSTTGTAKTADGTTSNGTSGSSASSVTNPVTGTPFTKAELGGIAVAVAAAAGAVLILVVRRKKQNSQSDFYL